jgi:hypothetical protein
VAGRRLLPVADGVLRRGAAYGRGRGNLEGGSGVVENGEAGGAFYRSVLRGERTGRSRVIGRQVELQCMRLQFRKTMG